MDIPLLARAILERGMRQLGSRVEGLTNEAMACLESYRWPGNARELQNEILRMLALADAPWLTAELLSPRVLRAAGEESEERDLALLDGLDGSLKTTRSAQARISETLIRRWIEPRRARAGPSGVGCAPLTRYGLEKDSHECGRA
jgi:two-component system response regulator HupR/HoxA